MLKIPTQIFPSRGTRQTTADPDVTVVHRRPRRSGVLSRVHWRRVVGLLLVLSITASVGYAVWPVLSGYLAVLLVAGVFVLPFASLVVAVRVVGASLAYLDAR